MQPCPRRRRRTGSLGHRLVNRGRPTTRSRSSARARQIPLDNADLWGTRRPWKAKRPRGSLRPNSARPLALQHASAATRGNERDSPPPHASLSPRIRPAPGHGIRPDNHLARLRAAADKARPRTQGPINAESHRVNRPTMTGSRRQPWIPDCAASGRKTLDREKVRQELDIPFILIESRSRKGTVRNGRGIGDRDPGRPQSETYRLQSRNGSRPSPL